MANFLFVLSHDDDEKATRCFQFVQIAESRYRAQTAAILMGSIRWEKQRNFTRRYRKQTSSPGIKDGLNSYFNF